MVVQCWWSAVVQLLSCSVCVLLLQIMCHELLLLSRYFCGVLHVCSTSFLPSFFFSTDLVSVMGARACEAHGWVVGICLQWSSPSGGQLTTVEAPGYSGHPTAIMLYEAVG